MQEVSYSTHRGSHSDPQYTAAQLAPALDALTADQPADQREVVVKTEKVQQLLNPFALSTPTSLALWQEARAALSRPSYFYTTMRKYGSNDRGLKKEDEGERFPVRVRKTTLEIEQGLADLRMLLGECLRTENEQALEALRDRIKTALEFS